MINPFGQFKLCQAFLENGQPCPSVATTEMIAVCGEGHVYQVFCCSRCFHDPDPMCAEDKAALTIKSAVEVAVKDGKVIRGRKLV